MRFILPFCLLILVSACVKKQIVTNRLEGTWKYTKYLHQDGSYTYFTDYTFSFEGGKADGKTFLPMETEVNGVETTGKYLVNKKGSDIILIYDVYHPPIGDTIVLEDMEKNSLIAHDLGGVRYFDKVE